MNESPAPSRLRRISGIALVLAVLVQLTIAIAGLTNAGAAPCADCGGGGGGGGDVTWHSVTTITPPATGAVNVVAGTTLIQSCSTGNTAGCTIDDDVVAPVRPPTSAWPTYTYAYASANGYSAYWTGRCTGTGVCTLPNDQETSSVVAHSFDSQPPTVSLTAPVRVGPSTPIQATASDNVGISSYFWSVCAGDGTGCAGFEYGSVVGSIHLQGVAAGEHVVKLVVTDTGNNQTTASVHVTLVTSFVMTSTTLPAYTEAPSLTFQSNEEADIISRECRAFPVGDTPPAYGSCTSATTYVPTVGDGAWTLQVHEVDDVGLIGDISQNTIVDNTAPSVSFTDGPAEGAAVTTTSVHFDFTATDANADTVTCKLDSQAAVPCTSPYVLGGYANGEHTFTVTATDKLGHVTSQGRDFSVAVPTTVTPTSSSTSVTYGHYATLSATVSPASATGTVQFVGPNGPALCTAAVHAGLATCRTSAYLPPAVRAVTLKYAGNYSPSGSHLTLTVKKASTAVHASAASSVRHNHHITVYAKNLPSRATGTVTVSRAGHTLCHATVSKGAAHCTLLASMAPGTYSITVHYGGSANYLASGTSIRVKVTR